MGNRISKFCWTVWCRLGEGEQKWEALFQVFLVVISNVNTILEALGEQSLQKGKSFKTKLPCRSTVMFWKTFFDELFEKQCFLLKDSNHSQCGLGNWEWDGIKGQQESKQKWNNCFWLLSSELGESKRNLDLHDLLLSLWWIKCRMGFLVGGVKHCWFPANTAAGLGAH